MTKTDDPAVVLGIVVATAAAYLVLALLIKAALDHVGAPETTTPRPDAPTTVVVPDRPHARPTAPDETAPITTVQINRARHRKGSPTCH